MYNLLTLKTTYNGVNKKPIGIQDRLLGITCAKYTEKSVFAGNLVW